MTPGAIPLWLLLASPCVFSHVSRKASATQHHGHTSQSWDFLNKLLLDWQQGAGTQMMCLLGCECVLEGWNCKGCVLQHDPNYDPIRSSPGSEQRVCHPVPTTGECLRKA